MRNFVLLVMSLSTQLALASGNVAVGTCRPRLRSFSTIQAAVSGVPAGSTALGVSGNLSGASHHLTTSQSRGGV